MKFVIKGTSGAGKTTVGRALAERLGLPYIELDGLYHGPNWSEPTPELFRSRVRQVMDAAPAGWVIDGNYDSRLDGLVVNEAETIVWLDLPLLVKLRRLWDRTTYRIRFQPELWNGNRETWRGAFTGRDAIFNSMVRSHVRHRREWPLRFAQDQRLVRLRSDTEVQRWLDEQGHDQ
jgi:adenylate kinase family enzyme